MHIIAALGILTKCNNLLIWLLANKRYIKLIEYLGKAFIVKFRDNYFSKILH